MQAGRTLGCDQGRIPVYHICDGTDIRTSKNPLVLLSYSVGYNRPCYDLKPRETEPQTYLWNVQKQSPRLFITVN